MIEIQPPNPVPQSGRLLFLAGSIEMGAAAMWQRDVCSRLVGTDWVILNPRRDTWDSTWAQVIEHPEFRAQVDWELSGIERADKVIFFLAPETKSPISLLELGFCAAKGKEVAVVCPKGFWRKGNVDIVCARYGLTQFESLEEACSWAAATELSPGSGIVL